MLEPGCGSGNFIGFAPERAEMAGADHRGHRQGALPGCQILTQSFADLRLRALDARRSLAARRAMAAIADLVGAVGLPTRAHQRPAGTAVVTDLLMRCRREEIGRAHV